MNEKPRALLIHPPVCDFALYDLFLKPYGLFRIAGALQQGGYEVHYLNALDYRDAATAETLGSPKRKNNGTGKFFRGPLPRPRELQKHLPGDFQRHFARYGVLPEVMKTQIQKARPDIVFLSTGMTYWYKGAEEAGMMVKTLSPDVPLIAGGVYASLMPRHCRDHTGADRVPGSLDGASLDQLLAGTGLPTVRIEGPLPDPPENRALWGDAGVLRLNEGCPFSCDYCASGALHPGFIQGDPEKEFDQFERLYRAGLRNFAFYDDALLINSESMLVPFLEKILDSDMSPSFYTPNAVHVSKISPTIAGLMKRAGFMEVRLGYESSSRNFHAAHGPKYREESFSRTVETLRRAGFASRQIAVYILAGLPEQRSDEIQDSVHEAREGKVRIHIAEFSPVPGSPLWEKCVAKSRYPLTEEPLFHNNTFFPMEWGEFTRGDLTSIKENVAIWNRGILT
jgi:hypothetical protein